MPEIDEHTLERISERVRAFINVKIAAELEFYLITFPTITSSIFFQNCNIEFVKLGLLTSEISSEVSENQYEISIGPYDDPILLAKAIIAIKKILSEKAETYNFSLSFDARPFPPSCGSALHIHFSAYDINQKNLFIDEKETGKETDYLLYVVAGLCDTLLESMIFFAPNRQSFSRFKRFSGEYFPYGFAPTKVSWGTNNRTVAIRHITYPLDRQNERIEHRVSGSDADPTSVIAAILLGVLHGLENKPQLKIEKTYGNVFDDEIDLPRLPSAVNIAVSLFENGNIIKPMLYRLTACQSSS